MCFRRIIILEHPSSNKATRRQQKQITQSYDNILLLRTVCKFEPLMVVK